MVDILRIIVTPTHQQSHLHQKSGLNVKRLEEITMEAMANWFNDEEQPENAEKKPLVEEIFKVARAEERCINGELGM
jgi:succinate dehydrogenase flavin-adding protein (antitoxin of CptAB toxin-antitoxin module)